MASTAESMLASGTPASQTKIVQVDPPIPFSSSKTAPKQAIRVQQLLNDTVASRMYERFGRNVPDQSVSDESSGSTSSGAASGKRSRYLREQDRCDIISRMAAGEKQADLAREFRVTRAAICHIKKNRVDILARSSHRDARLPTRARYQTISKPLTTQLDNQDGQPQLPIVYEVRSLPMTTLLKSLRDKATRETQFRRLADRAIRLLLEEALACADTKAIELITPTDCICEGIEAIQTSCGIALSDDALPMLELYSAIHPDSPTGYVAFTGTKQSLGYYGANQVAVTAESVHVTAESVHLPPNLARHSVFLLMPTCSSGADVCAAVQMLLTHGAKESSIFIVCIVISAAATSAICKQYPAIRIVTASIDAHVDQVTIGPGIGNFSARYNSRKSSNITS